MAKFTVETTFDSSENLIFACLDAQGNHVGVVKTKNDKIMFTNNENKTKHFEEDVDEFMKFMDENSYHLNRPSAEDSKWVEYQPNPKKYNTGDCTIRAYCKVENMTWEDAYDMAADYGMECAALPNDNKVVDKILTEKFKYTAHKLSKEERCTVKEFAVANPFGTYVLMVNKHVVAVVDGLYYDSWDSGDKKITKYWQK